MGKRRPPPDSSRPKAPAQPSGQFALARVFLVGALTCALLAVVAYQYVGEEPCAVEVRPSNIPGAGNGVFARQPLQRGELCCTYDGIDYEEHAVRLSYDAERYLLPLGGGLVRIGWQQPRSACGVAQIINDMQIISISHPTRRSEAQAAIEQYKTRESSDVAVNLDAVKAYYNSYVDSERALKAKPQTGRPPYAPFKMTHDVEAGEELFWPYGVNYWLADITQTTDSPMIAMLVWMFLCAEDLCTGIGDGDVRYKLHEPTGGAFTMPLSEHDAAEFIADRLGLQRDSAFWRQLNASCAGCISAPSSVAKLTGLADYLAADAPTIDVKYEPGDPYYKPV